ncbi:MAG: hypothetical protein RLZZ618_336 [Pseudomonadota bacterium]|jgi:hypothetical protein
MTPTFEAPFITNPLSLPALFAAGLIGMGLGLLLSKQAPRPHVGWLIASTVLAIAVGMAGARLPTGVYRHEGWAAVFHLTMGGVATSAVLAANACSTLMLVLSGRAIWRAASRQLARLGSIKR